MIPEVHATLSTWTAPHRLDFVGLDTTEQDDYEVRVGNLLSATHSVQGNVKALLMQSDGTYAELLPGEQIQLEFTLPNNSKPARTYIFYTKRALRNNHAVTP